MSSKQQANTALVRTVQRLSVRVQGYLPPHNFTVKQILDPTSEEKLREWEERLGKDEADCIRYLVCPQAPSQWSSRSVPFCLGKYVPTPEPSWTEEPRDREQLSRPGIGRFPCCPPPTRGYPRNPVFCEPDGKSDQENWVQALPLRAAFARIQESLHPFIEGCSVQKVSGLKPSSWGHGIPHHSRGWCSPGSRATLQLGKESLPFKAGRMSIFPVPRSWG